MNRGITSRRNFALSWGRKLFFGVSWPLSLMLGMIYLKSFIMPVSFTDWLYFLPTYLGHFGLLNTLVYFLLFYPLVLLTPSYYTARLWSLILIISLNLFITLDAICFSTYHLHIYTYILNIVLSEGFIHLMGKNAVRIFLPAGIFISSIIIWIRGDIIWRTMQTKFSNPIKNWYIVFIVVLVISGKLFYHFGGVHPKLASIFPFDINFAKSDYNKHQNQKFYYPSEKLMCKSKENPNVVLFLIKEWSYKLINEEDMPHLFHMEKHAVSFTSHMNVNRDADSGMFSLLYSLPASYLSVAAHVKPAIMDELEKRQYDIININNIKDFKNWSANRSKDETRPFYLTLNLEYAIADEVIQEMVLELQKENLLNSTHILFTALHSSTDSIPFMYFNPERKSSKVTNVTNHYDVMPTVMQNIWDCKNAFKATSTGRPLSEGREDWYLISGKDGYKIHDLKSDGWIEVINGSVTESGYPRKELIFDALKVMNRFVLP